MPTDVPPYTISTATRAKVKDSYAYNDYPAAYQAVADDLKVQAANGVAIDPNTLTWYSDAAQINDPHSNSFMHDFVRAYVSDYAQLTKHGPIDDAQFQKVSNDLARQVLETIGDTGKVLDFNIVGKKDTTIAAKDFAGVGVPVDQYAWPAYADLASFPWLRNFKNATWLNNLTPVEQRNILLAADMAGRTALWNSGGKGFTPADILNSISLDDKLRSAEGDLALQDVMKSALAIFGSLQQSAAALEGKSAVERLRHYAAQARANAAKKSATPAMQLHRNLMNLIQHQRSYAPIPNGAGGPARPAAGVKGAWAAPEPAGAQPAPSALQQRMDAMLQKLSPEKRAALKALGPAVLNQAGVGPSTQESGAPFQLAKMLQTIGEEPPGLPPGFYAAIAAGPASMASRFAAIGLAGGRLPSVAPRMAPAQVAVAVAYNAAESGATARRAPGGAPAPRLATRAQDGEVESGANAGVGLATSAAHRQALKTALQDYFDQQARLPPNGATGFDPLLTPAWPGLPLPA